MTEKYYKTNLKYMQVIVPFNHERSREGNYFYSGIKFVKLYSNLAAITFVNPR